MPGGRSLRFFLRVASIFYALAVNLRNWLIDLRPGARCDAGVPVISVGNVTAGGTGKTPVVAFLVNRLTRQSLEPGIISRGYRPISSPGIDEGNDEKRVLASLCPGTPHVQDRNRIAAARECVQKYQSKILVADDAFQHRRLARDLDVVLIDALNPWGYGYVHPRGLLREPPAGLRRADVVILTRADQVTTERRAEIWSEIRCWCTPPGEVEVAFEADGLIDLNGDWTPARDARADANTGRVVAFCGIGNPSAFRNTLEATGFEVIEMVSFPDHHNYSSSDLESLTATAREVDCTLVTTLKDLVKIDHVTSGVRLRALNIRVRVMCGEELLMSALDSVTESVAGNEQ